VQVLVFKDIKNHRWTLWSLDRKTHLGYRKHLSLKDCQLVVVESKRQQVLKTKKRFPHAWIIGTLTKTTQGTKLVTYNPFQNKSFMQGSRKIKEASILSFNAQGQVFAK
jgi:hypothetical protein